MEDARQGPVVRWLTILWIVALGIGYTSQYTGDLTGYRSPPNWPAIFVEMAVATGIYLGFLILAVLAWSVARVIILVCAICGAAFLVLAVGLAGLLGAWAFNLSQYLLMVLFTYCVAHLAFRCVRAPTQRVSKR